MGQQPFYITRYWSSESSIMYEELVLLTFDYYYNITSSIWALFFDGTYTTTTHCRCLIARASHSILLRSSAKPSGSNWFDFWEPLDGVVLVSRFSRRQQQQQQAPVPVVPRTPSPWRGRFGGTSKGLDVMTVSLGQWAAAEG